MKIIGGNRFALQGENGEVITATVTSMGTKFLVVYQVDNGEVIGGPSKGPMREGVPLRFKLKNSNGNRNNLNLGFTFAADPNADSIEYDIEVTGSAAGSDTSREFINGAFGIPGDNRQWRFFI